MSHPRKLRIDRSSDGIELNVLSLDRRHLQDTFSVDNVAFTDDTEPLIDNNFQVIPEMLLFSSGKVSQFFHQTGIVLFPTLYVAFSFLYLVTMYTGGLACAPHFDPNWLLKLPYMSNSSDAKRSLSTLRELSVWLSVAWSVISSILFLCIASIRHDQVVVIIEQKIAKLVQSEKNNVMESSVMLEECLDKAKWFTNMIEDNYRSVWTLYVAFIFSVFSSAFIRFQLVHFVLYLLYLLAMCIYSTYNAIISVELMLKLKMNIKRNAFSLFIYLLYVCFIVYFISLTLVYPLVYPIVSTTEDTLTYMKSLSIIAVDGIVIFIYLQMTNKL